MNEQEFRRHVDATLENLKEALYEAETDAGFEVEESGGAIHISFDEPPGKFVISPNAPVKQIWISALSTSFKLDWSEDANDFVLTKSGESIATLVSRLINQQLGTDSVALD